MCRFAPIRRSLRRSVLVLALAAVPLSACGSDDDGGDVPTDVPVTGAPTDTGLAPDTTMAGEPATGDTVPEDETTESSDPDSPGDPVPGTPDPEIVPGS